jgi:hypothetical protein
MTEQQRLELILDAVNYCKHVKEKGMPASAYTKALREPIHFLWERRLGTKSQSAQFRSVKSQGINFGTDEIRYDHAIPFSFIQQKLLTAEHLTISDLKEILQRFIVVCIITKEEDQLLNSMGLTRKMPENWDGKNPLARYEAAKIELVNNA